MVTSTISARRRRAFALCSEHGVGLADMAGVLGVSEKQLVFGLRRDGLAVEDVEQSCGDSRLIRRLMETLHGELDKLAAATDAPWSKARVDALAQMARTMDKLGEMQDRFVATQPRMQGGISPEELRVALTRIDERINKLADIRARELVSQEPERSGMRGGATGMADEGADTTTASMQTGLENLADTGGKRGGQNPNGS